VFARTLGEPEGGLATKISLKLTAEQLPNPRGAYLGAKADGIIRSAFSIRREFRDN
jgi:hypothetical protein